MVAAALVLGVGDLAGHPGKRREFAGEHHVALRLGDTTVDGPMGVEGDIAGTVDGVQVSFHASATARLTCVRCLAIWEETVDANGTQHFSPTPDEDGYGIVDSRVDVSGPATDELALALRAAPLCRQDCKGLCPICGTDLNSEPCDGHGEDSSSPFAVLKDLFDS